MELWQNLIMTKNELLFSSFFVSFFCSWIFGYLFFHSNLLAHFVIFSFVFLIGYFGNVGDINVKERAIKSLEGELSDLMFNETELVASAYRSSVSSNSFGKKNYTKFKKELIEHLLDNTNSKDILRYANELGDFEIPDETIYSIEQVIDDYSKSEGFDDEMDPYEYEHFCANQFLKSGWDDAEATTGSSDQGVDVIAKRGGDILVGQCKKYQKPVGNSAVQEVVAGMGYYGANIGVVISNSGYTNSARKLAEANNIKLIHHSEIKNL